MNSVQSDFGSGRPERHEVNEFAPLGDMLFLLDLDANVVEINPDNPDANNDAIISALEDTNQEFGLNITIDEFWKPPATTEAERLFFGLKLSVKQAEFFMDRRSFYHVDSATRPVKRAVNGLKVIKRLGGKVVVWSGNPYQICIQKALPFLSEVYRFPNGDPVIFSGDVMYQGSMVEGDNYRFQNPHPANKTMLANMARQYFGPKHHYVAVGDNYADLQSADFLGIHLCIRYNAENNRPPVGFVSSHVSTYYWIGDPLMLAAATGLYEGIDFEGTIELLRYLDKLGVNPDSRFVNEIDPDSRAYKFAYYCIQSAYWPEDLTVQELEIVKLAIIHRMFLTIAHAAQQRQQFWTPAVDSLLRSELPIYKKYLDYMFNLENLGRDLQTESNSTPEKAGKRKHHKNRCPR